MSKLTDKLELSGSTIISSDTITCINTGDDRLDVTISGIDAERELLKMFDKSIWDPKDIVSRYVDKPINENFYGEITIGGIQTNRRRLLIGR